MSCPNGKCPKDTTGHRGTASVKAAAAKELHSVSLLQPHGSKCGPGKSNSIILALSAVLMTASGEMGKSDCFHQHDVVQSTKL